MEEHARRTHGRFALGSRVRLRTAQIDVVCQSTVEQRALDREINRALNRERKADRSWGEDE